MSQPVLSLKNVTITQGGKIILSNVNLEVNHGEFIYIIGKTGSGKSTISNLISRMIDVSSGSILIDNQDIKNINLNDWRNQIGIVPQEVFLFSDSIQNNITVNCQAGFIRN